LLVLLDDRQVPGAGRSLRICRRLARFASDARAVKSGVSRGPWGLTLKRWYVLISGSTARREGLVDRVDAERFEHGLNEVCAGSKQNSHLTRHKKFFIISFLCFTQSCSLKT